MNTALLRACFLLFMACGLSLLALPASVPVAAAAIGATGATGAAPWAALQQSHFAGKKLEAAPFIRISAPVRAASGDQVPFAFSIDHPMTAARHIKSVTVLVDENPVPLTAVFHFTPASGKAEAATRIRFESDSPVHVVAESSDGHWYVNTVSVKASGGCSGPMAGDDPAALAAAGKMKMALAAPFQAGAVNKARLLIRHPMYTGLQRDLSTNGFRPAFFINKIDVSYNGKPVLQADTSIGLSENPTIEFPFVAERPGALQVLLQDNTGASFRQTLAVGGDT